MVLTRYLLILCLLFGLANISLGLNTVADDMAVTGSLTLGTNAGGARNITIYNTDANESFQLYTDQYGGYIKSFGNCILKLISGNNIQLYTAANQSIELRCGSLLSVTDADAAGAPRLTIDSANGNAATTGTLIARGATSLGYAAATQTAGDLTVDPTGNGIVTVGRLSATSGDNSRFYVRQRTGTVMFFVSPSDGGVSIANGTNVPKAPLHVVGDITCTGGICTGGSGTVKGTQVVDGSQNATFASSTVGSAKSWGRQTANPASTNEGDWYYNTVEHENRHYNGTSWVNSATTTLSGEPAIASGTVNQVWLGNKTWSGSPSLAGLTLTQPALGNTVQTLQSTAVSGDNPIVVVQQNRGLTTVITTPLTIHTAATANDKCYMVDVRVLGRRTSGSGAGVNGDCAAYWIRALYKNVGGNLTIVGTPDKLAFETAAAASADANLATSASNIAVNVQGPLDESYSWHVEKFEVSALGN
jgi:hypothetical protein